MKCELCGAEYKKGTWNWKDFIYHDAYSECPLSARLGFQPPSVIEGINEAIKAAKRPKDGTECRYREKTYYGSDFFCRMAGSSVSKICPCAAFDEEYK